MQGIIRASMTHQDNASPAFPVSSLPRPAVTSKPVLPLPSSGFLPPPPASAQFIVRTSSTSLTPQPSLDFDDDDDDDWDDFQAHEDTSNQPVDEEANEREVDEPQQASIPPPSTSTSTDGKVEDVNGDSTHNGAPAQNTGDHVVPSDGFVETVDTEEKSEDGSPASSLFNSPAFTSPPASRVPETTSQPEDDEVEDEDDIWDSFESAPAAKSVTDDIPSTESKPDDDVWDSSLPDEVETSHPEFLDERKSSERPGPDVGNENVEEKVENVEETVENVEEKVENVPGLNGDLEIKAVSAEVSHESTDSTGDVPEDGSGGDVFEEAVEEEETDANPSVPGETDRAAEAHDGNGGDVFEEAAEELGENPSLQGESNNRAEAQEVPSESNSHKQGIDHGGLVALAAAEAEDKKPLAN